MKPTSRVGPRRHETLVNDFEAWLRTESGGALDPKRSRVINLGTEDPPVIVEAKAVNSWPKAVREAVGQLYEYKYFQVVGTASRLVFLASEPVPDSWVAYLEEDRNILVAWREGEVFAMTARARRAFGLKGARARQDR